jgi:glycosyltransferase involved in cell wall biosynthesis
MTRTQVRAIIAGRGPDEGALKKLVQQLGLDQKVELIGFISEDEKRRYYAESLGVFYAPYNEDYGYVTLEAFFSHKPVITTTDSGGPLEFVEHGINGRVADPTPESLAREIDFLYSDSSLSRRLGEAGYQKIASMEITWDRVVEKLTED